jgi:2'-5' RNA ligase
VLRLFVGLSLPDGILARLNIMCSGIPGARWVEPENMHITLRFIGEVDETTAEEIHHVLAGIEAEKFSLEIGGLETFGRGVKIHTLWVAVKPEPDLLRLQKKIESALVRSGQPPEERKFTPHVTLARLTRPDPRRVQSFIEGNNLFHAGPFAVEQFTLFESQPGNGGPVYTALEDYPLS